MKKAPSRPRNYEIAPGLMRFSRARMFHKRGAWAKKPLAPKKVQSNKVEMVEKKIGGDKNGGKRMVPKVKQPRLLAPTRELDNLKFSKRKGQKGQKLRATITPGTVLILLAGRHKGKRVVFLKQLESGVLLVTGPLKLNNCPLRRIAQCYVIATKTKINIQGVQVPEHLNDAYFKRQSKNKRVNKESADIFAVTKREYQLTDQRKVDQKNMDKLVLAAIRKDKDKKTLFAYLGSSFSLNKTDAPHSMVF